MVGVLPIRLVLHYPSGERRNVGAIYQGGLAHEYFGVYPIGFKRKTCYEVFNEDIGFEQTFLGSILPFNDFARVVDIDVNARESMNFVEEKAGGKSYTYVKKNNGLLTSGKSFKARKTTEFNTQKSTYLDGYLMQKNDVSEKKFDLTAFITGLSFGAILITLLQRYFQYIGGI